MCASLNQSESHPATTGQTDVPAHGGAESDEPLPERSHRSDGIEIELALEVDDCDPPLDRWALPLLAQVVRTLGWSTASVSVAVVADQHMSRLHEQYKQTPGTTGPISGGQTHFSVSAEMFGSCS
jgi:hypothetical protein